MTTKISTEDWIEELKGISVLELSERVKALEETFGVSATAVAAAAPAATDGCHNFNRSFNPGSIRIHPLPTITRRDGPMRSV